MSYRPYPDPGRARRQLLRRHDGPPSLQDPDAYQLRIRRPGRKPRVGDTVHYIDFGDPTCHDATVTRVYPDMEDDDLVDVRMYPGIGGIWKHIEHDEGQGDGYWHWPCGGRWPDGARKKKRA